MVSPCSLIGTRCRGRLALVSLSMTYTSTEDGGPFPVIIFSHGNQNNAIDYVYTLETLASFGFIVAAPDHLNNTQDDVRIDFINSQAGYTLISCFDGLPSPCSRPDVPKSLTDRVHDISAIIDALPTWFGDRADISRVGVRGHSRGPRVVRHRLLASKRRSMTWQLLQVKAQTAA